MFIARISNVMIMPTDARNKAIQYLSLAESQISRSNYIDAVILLNQAGELAHKAQAADIFSMIYGTLGNVYQLAGRYDDAFNNYSSALKIQEKLAKHHTLFNVLVAATLNNIAALLTKMGRIDEAKTRYEGSLKIREKRFEADRALPDEKDFK
jgi:tetratricopeptide (TPR) repeat protein